MSNPSLDQGAASTLLLVSAIVLAAGKAERMGFSKLGLPLAGQSILSRVVNTALASCVSEVVVVLGHFAEDLSTEIPPSPRVKVVHNPCYGQGQHSSLRVGLAAVDFRAAAAVVLLGDQPMVRTEAIDALAGDFQKNRALFVIPTYNGQRGHPVLFSRALFPELLAAGENEGRREVMRRHRAECRTVATGGEPPTDVDTWQDYVSLAGWPQEAPATERKTTADSVCHD